MNQFIADEVAGLVKSRFDATLADKLMDETAREPEWLVDMMKKPKVSWKMDHHTHTCICTVFFIYLTLLIVLFFLCVWL